MAVSNYTRGSGTPGPGSNWSDRQVNPWLAFAVALVVLAALLFVLLGSGESGSTEQSKAKSSPARVYPTQTTRGGPFAPTEAGAVAAATAFETGWILVDLRSTQDALDWSDKQAASEFQLRMSQMVEERLAQAEDGALQAAKSEGETYFARTWPISYRVKEYKPDRAVVTIWSSNVAAIDRKATPRVSWTTDTVTVVREDDTWRVAGYKTEQPIVPYLSGIDKASTDEEFFEAQEGAEFYAATP